MATYSVRKLECDEAEALAALRADALTNHPLAFGSVVPDDPTALTDQMRTRLIQNDEATVLGALHDNELIGMVGVVRDTGRKERHKSFIWGMYVSGKHRNRSVGEQLLRAAIEQAGSWIGVEQIHLSVSETAADA